MRTITQTVYLFSELSKSLQRAAYENDYFNHDYFCSGEIMETIKKFGEVFGVRLTNYEVDYCCYSFKWDYDPYRGYMELEDTQVSGVRLAKYVWNNFIKRIEKGKYYSTLGEWKDGKYYYKCRYSSITKEIDNCPLTGVCWDCDMLDPISDCIHYKKMFGSFEELIDACFEGIFSAWRDAIEYENSFEYYKDMAEANDFEYDEFGHRI